MTFKHILVPLDGSQLAEASLPHARWLAQTFQATVLLLHVLRAQPSLVAVCAEGVDWHLHRLEILSYLKQIAERFTRNGIATEHHITEGRPAEQIVEFAREHHIDLIVIGAYGWGGVSEFPFGSTVQKILSVPCASQLVVRRIEGPAEDAGYRRILVPVDGSQRAEWAVGQAATLARAQNAELLLLQIIQVPAMLRRMPITAEESDLLDRFVETNCRAANLYLADLCRRFGQGISVRPVLRISAVSPSTTIRELARQEQVDLIALSAHGGSDSDECFGSACRAVLQHSHLPVLVFQDQPRATCLQQPAPRMASRIPLAACGM